MTEIIEPEPDELVTLAEWDAAYVNDLPDSAFAVILPGGEKDGEGKTVPRSLRKLPHHNAAGNVDMAHLRNALSREPQSDMSTAMHEHAAAHLEAHAQAEGMPSAMSVSGEIKRLDLPDEHMLAVDSEKRILGLRILRYNEVVEHPHYGRLLFLPGAFGAPDPKAVRLRMDHEDPPTGIGVSFQDRADAPYMDFRVSKTPRGDEQLTLARDSVSRGTSPGFMDVPGKVQQKLVDGKPTTVYGPGSALLAEVSTTWMPTFPGDGVMYVLSKDSEKGVGPVTEAQEAPVGAAFDYEQMAATVAQKLSATTSESKIDSVLAKFEELTELQRSQFTIPGAGKPKPLLKDWFGTTLQILSGKRISDADLKALALDDVITSEQPGLVPAVFTSDYNDIINRDRPFLRTTREVRPPATGNTMMLPIITTRAAAGTQNGGEKTAVTTTAPKVGTGTFNAVTILAGADISIQMILRADRSFLDLLDGEFAEAYALDAENKALAALITGYTDSASVSHQINDGGALDPTDPHFGEAWVNSITSSARRAPTHIWMNATAVGAFIDAKDPLTNAPLYSQLAAAFTAADGPGGRLSGLIPVYVPAMDDESYDVIVGPSSGFVWAEDPAIQLQADVPSVAGRDIVLAGTLFPAPRYADAFTKYTVAS